MSGATRDVFSIYPTGNPIADCRDSKFLEFVPQTVPKTKCFTAVYQILPCPKIGQDRRRRAKRC